MASVADTAEQMLTLFVEMAVRDRRCVITYKDMAAKLGRKGQQNLLQQPLDRARELCRERGLPEFPVMVISQAALESGTLLPADGAIDKYGGVAEIRRLQAEVMQFDWSTLRPDVT